MNAKACFLIIALSGVAAFTDSSAGIEYQSGWSSPSMMTLPSKNGPVEAIVRRTKFSWRHSTDHRIENRSVEAVIVPSQNLYWLGYSSLGIGTEREFFVFNNNIIGVAVFPGDVIQFYSSSNLLKTTNSSEEIDAIFNDKLNQIDKAKFDISPIQIGMENILGSFPFTGIPRDQGEPAPTVTKIDVDNSDFTIHFSGGTRNSVTASITFDQNFKPLHATLKGKQVFPR